jgi:hypothetical protein
MGTIIAPFYGSGMFIIVFTKARHMPLSSVGWIQPTLCQARPWWFMLMLNYHLHLGLSRGLCPLDQWYSTWGTRTPGGTRRHLKGYVKLKKINILFHDKHWIIRARFRVSHKRPERKDMRFGSAILSLSLLYAILIWAASFILFHIVHISLLC